MTYYIYVLYDPRGSNVRYIGRTKNPKTRLKRHQGGYANSSNIALRHWAMRATIDEIKLKMRILTKTENKQESGKLEQSWIEGYIQKGFTVLNNQRKEGRVFIDPFTFEIVPPDSGPQFTTWD